MLMARVWRALHGEIKPRERPGCEERTWREGLLGTPGLPTWISGLTDEWLEWAQCGLQTQLSSVWPCGSSEIPATEEPQGPS